MVQQIALVLLVPYSVPLLIPTWRWLLSYAVGVAILVAILFIAWYHAIISPTRTGLEGVGLVLPISAVLSTAAGTVVRTITLMMRARPAVIAIHALGAILLPACVIVWANR
jgi:hypothetical protein